MTASPNIKLAVAYLRKSTEEEGRQIESFAGQEREITRYAESHGYAIVKWYRESYTGTEVSRRKVFQDMLANAKERSLNFNYILCYDISRFGRLDNDEAGYYRHEFRKHGVEVIYVKENLQGDDTDDLIVSTKQWLAREHSRKISEYVCRNVVSRVGDARDKARAFNIGRSAPYGYDTVYLDKDGNPHSIVRLMSDRTKEVYSPDGKLIRSLPPRTRFQKANTDLMALVPSAPERVETVQRIFRWYTEEDMGQLAIVNRLNKEMLAGKGLASSTGKPWCIASIQEMLQNEHYAGSTVFNRRSMGKFFKFTKEDGGVKTERLPKRLPTTVRRNKREDWVVIENTHEPLVTRETFDSAQAKRQVRAQDSSRSGRSLGSRYLFSGKLICGDCGFKFHGTVKKKREWASEGYICGGYKLRGKHTCRDWFLPSDIIEPAVFEALDHEVRTLDISNAIGKAGEDLVRAPQIAERKRDELTRKLVQVEDRLEGLIDCITPENKTIISEKMLFLQKERDRLKTELDDTETLERRALASTQLVGRLVKLASEMRELWQVATVAEKKEFLSLMVESISIEPEEKTARIRLSSKYLEMKKLSGPNEPESFLSDGRGDRPLSGRIITPSEVTIKLYRWKPRCA